LLSDKSQQKNQTAEISTSEQPWATWSHDHGHSRHGHFSGSVLQLYHTLLATAKLVVIGHLCYVMFLLLVVCDVD